MSEPDDRPERVEPVVERPGNRSSACDVTTRALYLRIRQQEILSELGVLALQGTPFLELLNNAAHLTAEGLEAEFCKVLEYIPAERRLLVRAGVGWREGIVGTATIGADFDSPSGFALRTGKPVISNHLENEQRFRTPELLVQHGIRRAMNVILQGDGSPYGVLEVDSRSEGEFSQHDIAFLQGAANLLGMAIERQRIEENLRKALDRQQVLMREVNHRVNNSLQIVASMLQLHASAAASEDVRHELRQAGNRIAAVARAHHRLYRGDDIEAVDLGGYLREVCGDIVASIPGCEVDVNTSPGVIIRTDRAIPAVLLVNELITNAVKHAYPGRSCKLWVTLGLASGDAAVISVRDEGAGLPPEFDQKAGRLGMRLVRAFAEQLRGDLQVFRKDPGTEFVLKFPLRT
jgi:two-component sensor histidine kinase